MLGGNPTLTAVLDGARRLDLPGWWVAAGAVVQTIWNHVTGRDPEHGIKDYDVPVEIRNEARVHLWYEERFGVPCPPYESAEDAIDSFPATTSALGVRLTPPGRWKVYAPYGLADAFGLVLRPNPRQAPRHVYEAKVARWTSQWPELTALPWP
ncbi:nucleotidyltransferase family protein [Nonomuraea jabiensis]|uniref:nucleotidyltransferase family protein n=1 Tax=Nonomuraea jabiensis TaxID=882448 RepID=UPI003D70C541